jgi:hypothetical protein
LDVLDAFDRLWSLLTKLHSYISKANIKSTLLTSLCNIRELGVLGERLSYFNSALDRQASRAAGKEGFSVL